MDEEEPDGGGRAHRVVYSNCYIRLSTAIMVSTPAYSPPMRPARAILFGVLLLGALPLRAQDPFEIQVYEYETVPKGRWNLETHVNYVSKGTTTWDGPMAPTEGQFHTTFELTRGITDNFELAGYLLFGSYTGGSFQ